MARQAASRRCVWRIIFEQLVERAALLSFLACMASSRKPAARRCMWGSSKYMHRHIWDVVDPIRPCNCTSSHSSTQARTVTHHAHARTHLHAHTHLQRITHTHTYTHALHTQHTTHVTLHFKSSSVHRHGVRKWQREGEREACMPHTHMFTHSAHPHTCSLIAAHVTSLVRSHF